MFDPSRPIAAPPDLGERLRLSLDAQHEALRGTLMLTPTENVPFAEDLEVCSGPLHGVYNSDKVRDARERMQTDTQFAGRQAIEQDCRAIYRSWADALGAADATLRLLSGLHAHVVLFMAAARPGDTLLLLPESAGGHVSGRAIFERLGLQITEMVVDEPDQRVDIAATIAACADDRPDFVLVDRSEGLVLEDFSELARLARRWAIFDASQNLSNIIAGDHPNPFDEGFDVIVASTHKNFPSAQKALLAARVDDDRWRGTLRGVSTYVSNMHVASTYATGLTLSRGDWLVGYSQGMLRLATALEQELALRDVPVVRRPAGRIPTHHLWVAEGTRERAFRSYERLEACGLLVNFRKLPYGLGHGLRLGTAAAARLGMTDSDVPVLADLLADARAGVEVHGRARAFCHDIWERHD